MSEHDRRAFLKRTAAWASAFALPLEALAQGDGRGGPSPYGPLQPVRDETTGLPLLRLPAGFRCVSFGWTGDALADGTPTPPAHDGMAALPHRGGRIRLIRNHEVSAGTAFAPRLAYDPGAGGGTTTLEFDTARGRWVSSWASLSGTVRNCAGGPTPWGSWLTCEETLERPRATAGFTKAHGYVFEVPADGSAVPEPIRAMGRFVHEAVAVDPATGHVYETEDAIDAGFYRYVPRRRGDLAAGGGLQMFALAGEPQADTKRAQPRDWRRVAWVDIEDVDPVDPAARSVFAQGLARGGARFTRLEGAWSGNDRIYFTSTDGGDARLGQVWEYDPAAQALRLLFESPAADVLKAPDNICVSPRGGLVLCEDGGLPSSLQGLDRNGRIFEFGRNDVVLAGQRNGLSGDFRGSEFAGSTYSPDGRWLFVNVQSPGITFAITGPWGKDAL